MEDLNIELGTPSKNKKTKKSYELLRHDSRNGVESSTTAGSKYSEVKLRCRKVKSRIARKVDEYNHILGPFMRVIGIVSSILILVLWVEKAKGGYASMDSTCCWIENFNHVTHFQPCYSEHTPTLEHTNTQTPNTGYFDALTNDIHPSPGSQSLLALTLEESCMGLEYLERYRERNLGVIIVSAKDPKNHFMNRADPEDTEAGKFIHDVLNMHQVCDSRNLTVVMDECHTCSLNFHNGFKHHMTHCATPKKSLNDLKSAYEDKYVEGGPYEKPYKERYLWYDLFETTETYFNTKDKYGEEEARRRFVSEDGTVVLIVLQPRLYYFGEFPKYMENFLNPLIASYFPEEEESDYRVEVTAWPLLSKGAADGFQKDLASGDFFILPLSCFILAYTVGSIAVVVFGTLPISFMYVMLFFFCITQEKKNHTLFALTKTQVRHRLA